jgi:UDP-GlcNAc:undecaprenyl-phosphate/decaprenyl-phosphate GlcNAc-1-phosphate transferase
MIVAQIQLGCIFLLSLILSFGLTKGLVGSVYTPISSGRGVQDLHVRPTPRVGGLGVFVATTIGCALGSYQTTSTFPFELGVVFASVPLFLTGITEDLCRSVGVMPRLLSIIASSILFIYITGGLLKDSSIPVLGEILSNFYLVSWIFTIFALTGLTNAFNIIDGLNGLSSFCGFIALIALAVVAKNVGANAVFTYASILIVAMAGFFVFNFPLGKIFLGDAGAYFLGFSIATLSIHLVVQNPSVSIWFPFLTCIHPIVETLFSIVRRAGDRSRKLTKPDNDHIHQLVFRWASSTNVRTRLGISDLALNSLSSLFMWPIILLSGVIAVLNFNSSHNLKLWSLFFTSSYLVAYLTLRAKVAPNRST